MLFNFKKLNNILHMVIPCTIQPHHFWSTPQTPEQLRREAAEEMVSSNRTVLKHIYLLGNIFGIGSRILRINSFKT